MENLDFTIGDIINTVGLVILFITLLFIYKQLKEIKNQRWVSIYSDYTKRYADIMKILPGKIHNQSCKLESLEEGEYEKSIVGLRLYFDLCYEEFSLFNHYHKIEKDIWNDWEEGIEATLGKRVFQEGWEVIKNDTLFTSEGSFERYIDNLIAAQG